jgi:four helix bundle protein
MDECIRTGSFQDLRVWQRSIELVISIYALTKQFPRDEIYALTSQIRRAAISVSSNIAEGHGRGTTREFAMFLRNANGSLKEVETQLIVAYRLGFITKELASGTELIVQDVGRMLHGLIKYQTSKSPAQPRPRETGNG